MSLLILNENSGIVTYPLSKIRSVRLRRKKKNEIPRAIIDLGVDGISAPVTLSDERGDESVVESAEGIYCKILDGIANDKTVNLSDFTLTAPKKAPAKKAAAKKTEPEPETPAEQPSE